MKAEDFPKVFTEYRDNRGFYYLMKGKYRLETCFEGPGIVCVSYSYRLVRVSDGVAVLIGNDYDVYTLFTGFMRWPNILPWQGVGAFLLCKCVPPSALDDTLYYRYTEDQLDFLLSEDCDALETIGDMIRHACISEWIFCS